MNNPVDWTWKLREAVDRLKNSYEHIGRSTGVPFLAIVYPVEVEILIKKEWEALQGMLPASIEVKTINCLDITTSVLIEMGLDNIIDALENPMPGSNPQAELGNLWIRAICNAVEQITSRCSNCRQVVLIYKLSALYPAASPRALMQALWGRSDLALDGPIILFIPGKLIEPRVYEFLNQVREFMYRGDIL